MKNHGMNWVRQTKRLAIYLRDGLACVYCGACVEAGAQLSLDHVIPRNCGGGHREENLVTCCMGCNALKGNMTVRDFESVLTLDVDPLIISGSVVKRVKKQIRVKLAGFLIVARKLVKASRGSCCRAVTALTEFENRFDYEGGES